MQQSGKKELWTENVYLHKNCCLKWQIESAESQIWSLESYWVKQSSQTAAEDDILEDSGWDAGGWSHNDGGVLGIIEK